MAKKMVKKLKNKRKVIEKKKGAIQKVKEGDIVYIIEDKNFDQLEIKFSANAWWLDRRKVERLIEAFKIAAPIAEACIYAGITRGQWDYFNVKHLEFSEIK